jgi:TATA-binding protein-associated factor Taf7
MKNFILLIVCLFPVITFAQSVTDYFHIAANYYVNANKKNAQAAIQEGIQKFPNNQKLKDLASKIGELPDPEDEQNQQDQQNQDNQDQQDQEQQQQDQQKDEMQQKQQQQQQQINREDAQRILDAIAQEEKELQEKLQKKERAGYRPKIEKNW